MGFPLLCQGTVDVGTSSSLLVSWLLFWGSEQAAKIIPQTLSVRFGQCPLQKLDLP